MAICCLTGVLFYLLNVQHALMHQTCLELGMLISHLEITCTFSHTEQTPMLESLSTDQTLELYNIAYLCCKTIRLLVVSYGCTKTVFTQQNKSKVLYIFFIHPVINSTKGFIKRMS
jgi:hypothetical protein